MNRMGLNSPIGQISKGLVTQMRTAWTLLAVLTDITGDVSGVHGSVYKLGGLAVSYSLLLLELVEEGKKEDEDTA
jgi:hypothetical protein